MLSRSIGQMKWIWLLQRPRRALSDIKTFDAASRGALGSIELIVIRGGAHLATIAYIAVALSFAFDPFLQNLVHTSLLSVSDPLQSACLANTSLYHSVGPRLGASGKSTWTIQVSHIISTRDKSAHRPCNEVECVFVSFQQQPATALGDLTVPVQYK